MKYRLDAVCVDTARWPATIARATIRIVLKERMLMTSPAHGRRTFIATAIVPTGAAWRLSIETIGDRPARRPRALLSCSV